MRKKTVLGGVLRPREAEMGRIRMHRVSIRLSEKEYAHLKEQAGFSWLKNRAVPAQFNLGRKDEAAPTRRMGGAHSPNECSRQ